MEPDDNALIDWWEPVNRQVSLPEFIEARAKGTMERKNGRVCQLHRLTMSELLVRMNKQVFEGTNGFKAMTETFKFNDLVVVNRAINK